MGKDDGQSTFTTQETPQKDQHMHSGPSSSHSHHNHHHHHQSSPPRQHLHPRHLHPPLPRRPSSSNSTGALVITSPYRTGDEMLQYAGEPACRLPPLSSLAHTATKAEDEEAISSGGSYLQNAPLHQSSSPAVMQMTSGLVTGPTSTSSSPTSSNARADVFMRSLMRAAQLPDTFSPHQSPMSVHAIVEPSSASSAGGGSANRPKKRRTSSVQEPLQGSALEAMRRVHASGSILAPRRSETPSDYYDRLGQRLAGSNPVVAVSMEGGDAEHFRPTPSHMSIASSPSLSYAQQQRSTPKRLMFQSNEWDRSPQQPLAPRHQNLSSGFSSPGSHQPATFPPFPSHRPLINQRASQESSSSSSLPTSHEQTAALKSSMGSNTSSSRVTPTSMSSSGVSSVLGKRSQLVGQEHWNRQLLSRALVEEHRWADLSKANKRDAVRENILRARGELLISGSAQWPQWNSSMVTRVRCMYANIAQKSYGSEKRFLCPPPVVKISGPTRPCKWACVRVISGESPTPSSIVGGAVQPVGSSGEEESLLDANREARFGKLHVGNLSDSKGKTFRLQISLLRAEQTVEKKQRVVTSDEVATHPDGVIPSNAWSTFHSSPISVISKPARKSVRTRAASPAIASGSTVCLYNRLNSQTVRTKYLALEGAEGSGDESRKLVARQDGWEGFAMELLARPLNDPAVARANQRGMTGNDWGITYGSIICLRDINTNFCSDPMLICKVDKGRVEMSSLMGNSADGKLRFGVVGKDRAAARKILLGGQTSGKVSAESKVDEHKAGYIPTRSEGSVESSNESIYAANTPNAKSSGSGDSNGSMGGAVIQMQKVTLMHVSPKPCSPYNEDELECDLSATRAYLCSTAFEGPPDRHTTKAFAHSMAALDARYHARQAGQDADMTHEDGGSTQKLPDSPIQVSGGTTPCPVGYVRSPPPKVEETINGPSEVDLLEDPFCWTVVTICEWAVAGAQSDCVNG